MKKCCFGRKEKLFRVNTNNSWVSVVGERTSWEYKQNNKNQEKIKSKNVCENMML